MSDDVIRLMQRLFMPTMGLLQETPWQPAVDVCRTRRGWLVKFDLAGMKPEDIDVTIQGQRLTVAGTRRDKCAEEEGTRYYLMEIAYSHFERSIELPCNLDLANIASEYRDGMLVIRIQMEAHS